MTPDDAPVDGDDAIARVQPATDFAASRARTPPVHLDWAGVQSGARRVRQRRVAVVVGACAIVLATAGAAVAATGHSRNHVSIAGHGGAVATTTSEPSTSTTTGAASTAVAPSTAAHAGGTPTSVRDTIARPALPTDLTGTITLASTTWHAEQPQPVTLTVRNVSDHPILLPVGPVWIGLYVDYVDNVLWGSPDSNPPLGPGEERSFTATITPRSDSIGTARISAAFLRGIVMDYGAGPEPFLPGVPSIPILIAPPDWTSAQPLDPAMGKWNVVMSADATEVAAGSSVVVHARVTNVGDQPQEADAYGSLAIVCATRASDDAYDGQEQRVGLATIAPGEGVTFSIDYRPTPDQVGEVSCLVGMNFLPFGDETEAYPGLHSDSVTFTVLPAPDTTTTSLETTTTAR